MKKLTEALVKKYGMSDSLPNIAFPDSEIIKKPFSEETEIIIEKDIEHIINDCTLKVKKVLSEHLDQLHR